MPVIYILVAVGIVIGTWMYSGTVPYLIYLGLKLISPQLFLVTAFLITAIVSTATGTAWGSVATAGLALIGIASEMGIPLGMAAGAIISGGVFGDKMSPLSDTTNLAPMICGVDLFDHIRHMFWTTIPASCVGLIVWFIVGQSFHLDAANSASIATLSANLSSIFNWNLLLLLPAVIVIVGAMMRKPTVPLMLLSAVVAIALGMFFHGFSFASGVSSCVGGFKTTMISAAAAQDAIAQENVIKLLSRGGISSMMNIVNTIICAYAFAGVVERIGCLQVILDSVSGKLDWPLETDWRYYFSRCYADLHHWCCFCSYHHDRLPAERSLCQHGVTRCKLIPYSGRLRHYAVAVCSLGGFRISTTWICWA